MRSGVLGFIIVLVIALLVVYAARQYINNRRINSLIEESWAAAEASASVSSSTLAVWRAPASIFDSSCASLLSPSSHDGGSSGSGSGAAIEWPPPSTIPLYMRAAFTLNESIGVQSFYITERYDGRTIQWTREQVNELMIEYLTREARVGGGWGHYGEVASVLPSAMESVAWRGHNLSVLVIGSEDPWLEAMLFHARVAKVTTLEYSRIEVDGAQPLSDSTHFVALTPSQLAAEFENHLEKYDAVFSFSSLEHSGLGRYGDRLDPVGDLRALAQARCLMRRGALFFLGVPGGCDLIEWNAHRVYGKRRLSLIEKGFRLIDSIGAPPLRCVERYETPAHEHVSKHTVFILQKQ